MSYRAIAASLAVEDISIGERLTLFALASYANRVHLAWPAGRTAAARAGLGRRQYIAARDRMAARGLIAIDHRPGESVVRLQFAERGPTCPREINAVLFEATLAHSTTRGGARALLAALAALADADGLVEGASVDDICAASGLSDRTYRRARSELIERGDLIVERPGGGRGCQNLWRVHDRREAKTDHSPVAHARPLRISRQLPLVAVVRSPPAREQSQINGRALGRDEPEVGQTNPGVNPGQICTPPTAQTPAETPAETPASHAREARESLNQGTRPPDPPQGGQPRLIEITERFTTSRGRSRMRRVGADPSELGALTDAVHHEWSAMRQRLLDLAGETVFNVWLANVDPIALSRRDDAVLLAAPAQVHAWVRARYGPLFAALPLGAEHRVRMADERELALHTALNQKPVADTPAVISGDHPHNRQEAI